MLSASSYMPPKFQKRSVKLRNTELEKQSLYIKQKVQYLEIKRKGNQGTIETSRLGGNQGKENICFHRNEQGFKL